jgi:hypothetical protein
MSDLDQIVTELRRAAERLRSGEPSDEEAAALVERCAELAAQVGADLERRARDARSEREPA